MGKTMASCSNDFISTRAAPPPKKAKRRQKRSAEESRERHRVVERRRVLRINKLIGEIKAEVEVRAGVENASHSTRSAALTSGA